MKRSGAEQQTALKRLLKLGGLDTKPKKSHMEFVCTLNRALIFTSSHLSFSYPHHSSPPSTQDSSLTHSA